MSSLLTDMTLIKQKRSSVAQWLASLAFNHRQSPLCGLNPHKWQCCPKMTLAVERDVKPQL